MVPIQAHLLCRFYGPVTIKGCCSRSRAVNGSHALEGKGIILQSDINLAGLHIVHIETAFNQRDLILRISRLIKDKRTVTSPESAAKLKSQCS